jgi:hypothetical protein
VDPEAAGIHEGSFAGLPPIAHHKRQLSFVATKRCRSAGTDGTDQVKKFFHRIGGGMTVWAGWPREPCVAVWFVDGRFCR